MDFSTLDILQSNAGSFAWALPRQAVQGIESVNTGPDFSAWAMFREASLVVQIVMVILIVASFWSWAVIIEKVWRFRSLRRQFDTFEASFWSGTSLDDLYSRLDPEKRNPIERVFAAGMQEWRRSFETGGGLIAGASQRIDRAMGVAVERETQKLESWMGFLATVGAIAPFVGLFGTVWGIKNSFEQIAVSQNTNLSVVAPGIAEALLATALGLVAAIPAVVAYNALSDRVGRLSGRLEAFSDEFATLLSRQLERRAA
jgi:biopolymer transport protein TolQ